MSFMNAFKIPNKIPLIIADEVLLPSNSLHLTLSANKDVNLIRSLHRNLYHKPSLQTLVGVLTLKQNEEGSKMHKIGTVGIVVRCLDASVLYAVYRVSIIGLCRFELDSLVQEHPFRIGLVRQIDRLPNELQNSSVKPRCEDEIRFRDQVQQLWHVFSDSTVNYENFLSSLPLGYLVDFVAYIIGLPAKIKLDILLTLDPLDRMKLLTPVLKEHLENMHSTMVKSPQHRGPLTSLPGQYNRIKGRDEVTQLKDKISKAGISPEAMKVIEKELDRFQVINPHNTEYSMLRSYLDLVSDLPWSKEAKEIYNISKARKDLDSDHYGMENVKKRVLEYLAVCQLRGNIKGPILCLVGPPGVGKTSIARSIAATVGRPFHRMSLGGISDQHEIRGHRRTYLGSMPGRIIQGLRTVKVKNPVFLLDEVDKLTRGIQGDPASALLEVLDPEQNHSFVDTYLNAPFDLSKVLFIATANNLKTVPPPLLDRLEIINVPGYTQEEKIKIAEFHLVSKELKEHGLDQCQVTFPEDILASLVAEYTREAGVRSLQRKIGAICRSVAVEFAEKNQDKENGNAIERNFSQNVKVITSDMVHKILGPPIFQSGLAGRVGVPGVAVGLAWTPNGGEVLVVEASLTEGDSSLILTGQLGNVMQESAKIALSWVRHHAEKFGLDKDFMMCGEIHIHFPAGAIAKDGPSAGVTMITVLISLLSNKCVRPEVAMTGEITLNGIVLPVGGIKEKVLAARRAGLTKVIIPAVNKKDLIDIPKVVLDDLEIILVNTVDEVLLAAFEEPPIANSQNMQSKL